MSAATRLQIVKMTAIKNRTHKEIGELLNVPTQLVSNLSSSVKRSKPSIVKRRERELKKLHNHASVVAVVSNMINQRKSIWTVKHI